MLDAHAAYLDRRWAEGWRNAAQLWRELVSLGFAGRPSTVRAWARRRRATERDTASPAGVHAVTLVAAIRAADRPPANGRHRRLPAPEQDFVAWLPGEAPKLADAIAVAKRLNRLLRHASEESLDRVLTDAAGTLLAAFATNLRPDLGAVQAALEMPRTASPAKGQINRIKTIQRSMYGRASFQLLRARVLNAA